MTIREACELWVERDMNAIPQSVLVKLQQLDPDDQTESMSVPPERWAR